MFAEPCFARDDSSALYSKINRDPHGIYYIPEYGRENENAENAFTSLNVTAIPVSHPHGIKAGANSFDILLPHAIVVN